MKFTKTSEKQLLEFFERMDDNCCVSTARISLPTRSRAAKASKPFPPFVKRQERKNATMKNAKAYFNHPHNKRRMVCFALDIDAYKAFMFESMRGREYTYPNLSQIEG